MKSIIKLFVLMVVLFDLVSVQPALAQATTPVVNTVTDDQVNAIAKQLYCPVCENIPLDVCPTQACAEWRGLIREMLAQGKSEAEIKTYFVQQYGDRVLGIPPARGINWLVYIIPPFAILVGVYILYRALQEWRKPISQLSQPAAPLESNDQYVQRLEEELRKR